MANNADSEDVVMTPLKTDHAGNVIKVERLTESNLGSDQVQHIAGGPYKGIVISKKANEVPETLMPEAHREFNVDMLDPKGQDDTAMVREKRILRFWFMKTADVNREGTAEMFFKKVVNPDNFPRDSIRFVIRVLNLVKQFPDIKKIELEMRPLTSEEQTERADYVITKQVTQISHVTASHTSQDDYHSHQADQTGESHGEINGQYSGDHASEEYGSTLERARTAQDDAMLLKEEGLSDATYEEALEAAGSTSLAATPSGAERIRKSQLGSPTSDKSKLLVWLAKRQRVLTLIEDAYPNAVSLTDIIRLSGLTREDVEAVLRELHEKGVVDEMEKDRWVRIQASKKTTVVATQVTNEGETKTEKVKSHDVQVVAHIPVLPRNEQPTVAVITLMYCEKVAVDAMMDTKTTYVRYKTEGEGTVYTVGLIGKHRVVSTKLARIGRGQGAMMSSENTVTRLLGTFGYVEHVFLVGVGGGVANYNDDSRHVRLGDVVVSKADFDGGPIYIRCASVDEESGGGYSFSTQCWNPRENDIEAVGQKIGNNWESFLEDAIQDLQKENPRVKRPAPEKDRLIRLKGGEEEEVPHPTPTSGSRREEFPNLPVVHYGAIGAGEDLNKDGEIRQDFALLNEVKVIDCGYEGVLESIDGNRKDSFAIIRGVADYVDGTTKKEWQSYASVAAAAVLKAILQELPRSEE